MTDHPKEHGLLFKPDMVRAYFAGNKSMTRRVITRRNSYVDGTPASKEVWDGLQFDRAWIDRGPSPAGNAGPYLKVPRPWFQNGTPVDESVHRVYPRHQVGDTIWGREGWAVGRGYDGVPPRDLPGPSKIGFRINMAYRSDPETEWSLKGRGRWRPSIFLPRWAARIVAPIVAVRPERVQDISEEDAKAEGCAGWTCSAHVSGQDVGDIDWETSREEFEGLWDRINGKRGFGIAANPWVWVLTFKRA